MLTCVLATKSENVEMICMLAVTLKEPLLSIKSKCALAFMFDSTHDALISGWTGNWPSLVNV